MMQHQKGNFFPLSYLRRVKHKFIQNIANDSAMMRLYGPIGGDKGISGAAFAEEMFYLADRVKNIDIRTNSPGGNIIDAFSIYSCMRVMNEMGVNITCYIDFMAASAAGWVTQGANKVYGADNGLFMMHNAQGPNQSDKEKEILQKMKDSIIPLLTARASVTSESVSNMMDKETWLKMSEAKTMGFVDDTFPAVAKMEKKYQNQFHYNFQKLYEISNSILTKEKMEDNKVVNLAEVEDKYKNQISDFTKKVTDLESENADLKAQLATAKAAIDKANDDKAAELVENAIKDGKLKAEAKEDTLKLAKANYDSVKNMLGMITGSTAKRFTNVAGTGETQTAQVTGREDWTHRDWEKKDPTGLKNMRDNEPEMYQELYNKSFANIN